MNSVGWCSYETEIKVKLKMRGGKRKRREGDERDGWGFIDDGEGWEGGK